MTPSMQTGTMSPLSNISGYGLKQPKHLRQIPQFTAGQQGLFQSLLGGAQPGASHGLGYLSKLASGDEESFAHLEQPALQDYEQALSKLGNRFANTGFASSSSPFQNAARGLGQDYANTLQSQRSQLQMDALTKLLGISQNLLGQRPYMIGTESQQPGGGWSSIAPALGGAIPGILAAILGGPAGAAGGGALGALLSHLLGGQRGG
jgi:hypothetical protein